MKFSLITVAFVMIAGPWAAQAQRHKVNINTETPEGQLLQQIGQESDETKKLALEEEFATKYAKDENIGWVYAQMQPAYIKAGQLDKALDVGEKLLAIDPEDLDTAHQNLKASEGKKDPDLIRKWSDRTAQIAQKVAASPQPTDADQVEDWKKRVDYAKQVNTYSEYSLNAAALQATDPRKKLDLIGALQQRNPQSQYLPQLVQQQFVAYQQIGDNASAVVLAEKTLASDQSNEDMLLVVADAYMQRKKNPEKVIEYGEKMVQVINSKPKPEGISGADWAKRKALISGLGYYMAGKTYFDENKLTAANKALRAALPFLEGNELLKARAETLFDLGLANYKMGRMQDAAAFTRQCAAFRSPFQAQAAKNLTAMRQQHPNMK